MTYTNSQQPKTYIQLIRRPELLTIYPRSKSALQLDEKAGLFCPSISIGQRAVAYLKHEAEAVIQARVEGKSQQQIKQLVSELIKQRTKVV